MFLVKGSNLFAAAGLKTNHFVHVILGGSTGKEIDRRGEFGWFYNKKEQALIQCVIIQCSITWRFVSWIVSELNFICWHIWFYLLQDTICQGMIES